MGLIVQLLGTGALFDSGHREALWADGAAVQPSQRHGGRLCVSQALP